jgi:hypothetical protein
VPVAIGDTLVGAFVAGSADHLGGFDLDQLLELQADRLTDQIDTITSAERVEQFGQGSSDRAVRTGQFGQGRLRQADRLLLLMVCTWRYTP